MSLKNSPNRAAAVGAAAPRSTRGFAGDLGSQPFAIAAEGGTVLLRGLQEMRKNQYRGRPAGHAAACRRGGKAGRLACRHGPAGRERRLRGGHRCWQQLVDEALEIQSELLACATRLANTEDAFAAARLLHA